ncbi:MAG: HD domain-containing phosphohydrolase [Baekduia sp.]
MGARTATKIALSAHATFLVVAQTLVLTTSIPQDHIEVISGIYVALNMMSALILAGYALTMRGRERLSWMLLGAGVVSWNFASVYLNAVLVPAGKASPPTIADAAFLAFVPLAIAGMLLRLPPRLGERSSAERIDGVAAALAAAALSAAIVLETVVANAPGRTAEALVISAFPLGDALLIGIVVATFTLNRWRGDRASVLVGLGIVCFWIADSGFALLQAQDAYVPPSPVDIGWPLSVLLFAVAARHAAAHPAAQPSQDPRPLADVLSPVLFALIGLAILVTAAIADLHPVAVALAALSLSAMLLRLGLSLLENARMLNESRREALTDALTGLGNRRALLRDLGEAMNAGAPSTLVLFDLDGFKGYNDVFGHPAGDALLERLARSLEARVATASGASYRIGGDEFCALVAGHAEAGQLGLLVDALSESGEGFQIGASFGAIHLPPEAGTAEDALRLVDQRMYERKHSSRSSARTQSSEVLVQALCARVPQMQRHLESVRDLATATAVELGVELSEIERLRRAAMLHDIGCMSIPDTILSKPGPLSEEETAFVRQHPAAGARILDAAPALHHLAPIVRSIHERFDGSGYPDGLAGAQVPLEARIIAVCDAFDTMVHGRPFRGAMSEAEGLSELRAGAGGQFDPEVVAAFAAALSASAESPSRAA